MIASVAFRNFKALRNTQVDLAPFNLVIGPNGSGKTSLIQALVRLRELSASPASTLVPAQADGLELTFRFMPPYADIEAKLRCSGDLVCNFIEVSTPSPELWADACKELGRVRSYALEHTAMARPDGSSGAAVLAIDGSNLGLVLSARRRENPPAFELVEEEFCRLFPEFSGVWTAEPTEPVAAFGARLRDGHVVSAANLSQGTLYTLALLTLAFDPAPASIICIEELDRGIHPRMLREIRDLLYRLSYPSSFGEKRAQTQIIATTHSPYLLDLFRDHPEEVIIAQKQGQAARFERLADRADLPELLQEGTLGDMWFAGILGGVPDENEGQGSGTPKLW